MSHDRLPPREFALECRADHLLKSNSTPGDGPLTMRQLARKTRRERPAGPADLDPPSEPEAVADLRFIGATAPLTDRQRAVFELWVDGWNAREIGQIVCVSPATACRDLRSALMRCWLMGPIPFGDFCRRTVYRPPSRQGAGYRSGRRCEICAAPLWDDGSATTCGQADCEAVIRMRRRLDRRRCGWRG
ncbi:MAG: sigma-70 family RNA polymerase sigma factor [Armatimonadetes bacterium]|nr:sigma-70 family RNA polymerase sigma factor [Armatimonadota bacterium]